jgi:hypothetical protein
MTVDGDDVLRVESRQAAAHALIGIAGSSPAGRSAVELLQEDRRLQLAAEEADARRGARKANPPQAQSSDRHRRLTSRRSLE